MMYICKLMHFLLDAGLTLKAPFKTAADDIYKCFFIVSQRKITLDISCESLSSRGFT